MDINLSSLSLFFLITLDLTNEYKSAYNKLNACQRDVIEPKCGTEAYELTNELFRASFSRLPSVSCAKYDYNSKACAQLLPPAGSVPKGAKSHSVLSKLLTAYVGQN